MLPTSIDRVPPDGSPIRVKDATHIATIITTSVLFGVLLLLAIACVLFNILFRERRYSDVYIPWRFWVRNWCVSILLCGRIVKLTSPPLNYILIFGTVLLGTAIILYTVPVHSTDLLPPLCIVSCLHVIVTIILALLCTTVQQCVPGVISTHNLY